MLLLVENPWQLEVAIISEVAGILGCNYTKLYVKFIEMRNMEVIF